MVHQPVPSFLFRPRNRISRLYGAIRPTEKEVALKILAAGGVQGRSRHIRGFTMRVVTLDDKKHSLKLRVGP